MVQVDALVAVEAPLVQAINSMNLSILFVRGAPTTTASGDRGDFWYHNASGRFFQMHAKPRVCLRACVCVCVRVCVRACVCVCQL